MSNKQSKARARARAERQPRAVEGQGSDDGQAEVSHGDVAPRPKAGLTTRAQVFDGDIRQYIEAAAESTERSRKVIIILTTASVLTLVGTWNSKPNSWTNARRDLARASVVVVEERQAQLEKQQAENHKQQAEEGKQPADTEASKAALKEYLRRTEAADDLRKESPDLYGRAQKSIDRRNIKDKELLSKYQEYLELSRLEHVVMMRMPFFGISFDVNDLAIFAGVTFGVVLLWFRYSLSREASNIMLAFQEARRQDGAKGRSKEQLRFCYDMLTMRQVLNTPKILPQEDYPSRLRWFYRLRRVFWIVISKGFFAFPWGVYAYVIHNNNGSRDIGQIVSPSNTEMVMICSWVFLGIITVLTILCYYIVIRGQQTWTKAAEELGLR